MKRKLAIALLIAGVLVAVAYYSLAPFYRAAVRIGGGW
jgi:hypothetical protein